MNQPQASAWRFGLVAGKNPQGVASESKESSGVFSDHLMRTADTTWGALLVNACASYAAAGAYAPAVVCATANFTNSLTTAAF
eukprot:6486030-Amphidinium_carterae.1